MRRCLGVASFVFPVLAVHWVSVFIHQLCKIFYHYFFQTSFPAPPALLQGHWKLSPQLPDALFCFVFHFVSLFYFGYFYSQVLKVTNPFFYSVESLENPIQCLFHLRHCIFVPWCFFVWRLFSYLSCVHVTRSVLPFASRTENKVRITILILSAGSIISDWVFSL